MKFSIQNKISKSALKAFDAIFLPVWVADQKPPRFGEMLGELDSVDQKFIKEFVKKRAPKTGEARLLRLNKMPVFVFLVCEKTFTEQKLLFAVRKFIKNAKAEGLKDLGMYLDDYEKDNLSSERTARLVSENALLAHYEFSEQFKTPPQGGWKKVETVTVFTFNEDRDVAGSLKEGEAVAEAVNYCRTLSNMPPSDLKPEGMAEAARTVAGKVKGLSLQVFDEKKLKAMGMNAILSVGQGSASPPRLIVMEYRGAGPKDDSVAFVGKGVTFDSGGLNIKPGEHMADMHMDMSGGAAVIYTMYLLAKLKVPVNAVGIVPAVENMPSGLSYRQGDIVKAFGGKTIEIGNTDAEGRVILSDAIEYAKTKKPALVITIATLTGAAMVALGTRMSGLFVKNNKELRSALEEIGNKSGDLVWPLPLTEDNERDVEGNFADVTNTSKTGGRYGGASAGAAFLSHFAGKVPFAHVDMAPRMTTNPDEELSKGAAGFGVRYFLELARRWSKIKEFLQAED